MALVVEHAHLGAVRAFAFLPADFLDALGLGAGGAALLAVDLVEEQPARQKSIERLGALLLALDPNVDHELIAKLQDPSYDARVERAVVLTIEAFDWNCPQHITPRFSQTEVEAMIAPLVDENRALKAQLAQLAPGNDR